MAKKVRIANRAVRYAVAELISAALEKTDCTLIQGAPTEVNFSVLKSAGYMDDEERFEQKFFRITITEVE